MNTISRFSKFCVIALLAVSSVGMNGNFLQKVCMQTLKDIGKRVGIGFAAGAGAGYSVTGKVLPSLGMGVFGGLAGYREHKVLQAVDRNHDAILENNQAIHDNLEEILKNGEKIDSVQDRLDQVHVQAIVNHESIMDLLGVVDENHEDVVEKLGVLQVVARDTNKRVVYGNHLTEEGFQKVLDGQEGLQGKHSWFGIDEEDDATGWYYNDKYLETEGEL